MPSRFYVRVERGYGTAADPITSRYFFDGKLRTDRFGYTTIEAANKARINAIKLYGDTPRSAMRYDIVKEDF